MFRDLINLIERLAEPLQPESFSQARRARVELTRAEIAKGHDGFLRGAPEPVLILAVYAQATHRVSLIARTSWRLKARGPYPSVAYVKKGEPFLELRLDRSPLVRLMLVGIAVERDSAKDVRSIYASLPDLEAFRFWRAADEQPVPRTVGEWLADRKALSSPPTEVHVLHHQRDLREIEADEWVGASVAILEPWKQDRMGLRMQFASPDERNDWAFDLEFRAGR